MKELSAVIITIGLFALVAISFLSFDQYRCEQMSNMMGLPHYWSLSTTCMVQADGKWYPITRVWTNGIKQ